MTRQVRNVDQIRLLLRQMDRSVDDARNRREGTQRPPSAPAEGSSSTQASSPPAASAAPRPAAPQMSAPSNAQRFNGTSNTHAGLPPMKPNTPPAANPSAPPRLKAKPKRSSDDPLQDFQQRQAS